MACRKKHLQYRNPKVKVQPTPLDEKPTFEWGKWQDRWTESNEPWTGNKSDENIDSQWCENGPNSNTEWWDGGWSSQSWEKYPPANSWTEPSPWENVNNNQDTAPDAGGTNNETAVAENPTAPKAGGTNDGTAVADDPPAPDAGSTNDGTAVAGVPPTVPPMAPWFYTMNHFLTHYPSFTDSYKQHSAALKWFRDCAEEDGHTCALFKKDHPAFVPEIIHPTKTTYKYRAGNDTEWRWQEMIAQMDKESMRYVVEGPPDAGNRSRGVHMCQLVQTQVYDHKRCHAVRHAGLPVQMLYAWDFVVFRENNTVVSLHPNWSNTKIQCKEGVRVHDTEFPRTGKGGTSGRGTFQYFIHKQCDKVLRFDARKQPDKGKGKGSGARGSQQ